jgi:hypothetical protein
VLAQKYRLLDVAVRLQPTVVNRFVEFCDTPEFSDLLYNCDRGDEILRQLVKEFTKAKEDRIAEVNAEKASLKQLNERLQTRVDAYQSKETEEERGRQSRTLHITDCRMVTGEPIRSELMA